MRTIEINGHQLNMAYNLKTACLYQRVTGRSAIENIAEEFSKLENLLVLGWCMLMSSPENDESDIPDTETILTKMSFEKASELIVKVNEGISEFFKVEPGDQHPVQADQEEGNA